MSQYYVRANQAFTQKLCPCDMATASLPAAVRAALQTDLFAKYMPSETEATGGGPTVTRTACYTVVSQMTYDAHLQTDEVPSKTNTVTLSALHHSVMTNTAFRGVYWAFLMSHNLKGKKKDTNIGVSKNPIFSVMAHNNQALINHGDNARLPRSVFPVIYDKDTASAAPHWKLDTAIGPFLCKQEAIGCCHRWVRKTRGTDSKRSRAPELVELYGNKLYSSQIPINQPLESHLLHLNAPFEYIATTHTTKQQCTRVIQPYLQQQQQQQANEQQHRQQRQKRNDQQSASKRARKRDSSSSNQRRR